MGYSQLRTDYTDASYVGNKKYRKIDNADGTVSFEDVTEYVGLENSYFSSSDINKLNEAINHLMLTFDDEDHTNLYADFQSYIEEQKRLWGIKTEELQEKKGGYDTEILNYLQAKQNEFTAWFNTVKDRLSEDNAGRLSQEIDGLNNKIDTSMSEIRNKLASYNLLLEEKANKSIFGKNIRIIPTNWITSSKDGYSFEFTYRKSKILRTDNADIYYHADSIITCENSGIYAETVDGGIKFYTVIKPTANINLNFIVHKE